MKNQKKKQTPFGAALKYFLHTTGVKQKALAEAVKIGQSYIPALKEGVKTGSELVRREIATFFGQSYEDFLAVGEKILSSGDIITANTPCQEKKITHLKAIEKHQEPTLNFIDQEAGKDINRCLMEIERLNPDVFYSTAYQLKKKLKDLKPQATQQTEDRYQSKNWKARNTN